MNRMRELRERKGISMKEAARQLNLPYTTYVNYEKCDREPNSETLIAIADFYETSIDYLLRRESGGEESLASSLSPQGSSADERLEEINDIYHDMNDDGQELMLANARSLHALGKYNAVPPGSSAEPAI